MTQDTPTPDELDALVEELLAQPPPLATHQELADYKARARKLLAQTRNKTLEEVLKHQQARKVLSPKMLSIYEETFVPVEAIKALMGESHE